MSAGFYRGTSHEQTPFFKNKDKLLLENRKWPSIFDEKVDMTKVNTEVIKAWINHKITKILGFEDDIVISYCVTQLCPDEALLADEDDKLNAICPKKLTISLTGFFGKSALSFVEDLWAMLLSAQRQLNGIPPEYFDNKKLELDRKKEEAARINEDLLKKHEQMVKEEFNKQIKTMATGQAPRKHAFEVAHDALMIDGAAGTMRGWEGGGYKGPEPVRVRQESESRSASPHRKNRRMRQSSSRSRSPSRSRSRDRGRQRGH